jgi:hypothetical protein
MRLHFDAPHLPRSLSSAGLDQSVDHRIAQVSIQEHPCILNGESNPDDLF